MAAYLAALAGVRLTARRTATFMLQVTVDKAVSRVLHTWSIVCAVSWMSKLDLRSILRWKCGIALRSSGRIAFPIIPFARMDLTMATAGKLPRKGR